MIKGHKRKKGVEDKVDKDWCEKTMPSAQLIYPSVSSELPPIHQNSPSSTAVM